MGMRIILNVLSKMRIWYNKSLKINDPIEWHITAKGERVNNMAYT